MLKQQGDGRRLMGNFLWLSLLQVAGYVFPLLTVPYLAHTIGVDKYGEIAFASAVMVYFQTLVDYGFIFSAVRDIARVREDLGAVSAIYSRVMWARFFLTLVAFTLLVGLILTVPKFYEMRWVILASFLLVVGHAMFPDWIFQAVERMKFIVIFNVGIKLLFTVAVFAFIRRPDDYLLQPVFTSVGFVLSGMGAMWLIHRWGIRLGRPRAAEIKRGLKSNFDLFVNQLVPNLYNSASVLMLGFMHGDAANGVYGAANQFNTVGSSFFSIISRTFFPFLSRRPEKHHVFVVINLVSSGLVAALLFGFAALIVHTFFPGSFDGSIVTLQILSVSLVFLAMSNVYGTNLLILRGRERELRQITLVSSLIGLAVGIPLVYFYSYIGVALTVVTARGAIALLSYLKARRIDRDLPPVAA